MTHCQETRCVKNRRIYDALTGALKTSTCQHAPMERHVRWSGVLSELDPEHEDLLFGTSLSRRFSQLPLWLSHPANIGMFYGFLISLALIFPYILRYDSLNESFSNWLLFSALFMSACLILGFSSLILVSFSNRMPMTPPRIVSIQCPSSELLFSDWIIPTYLISQVEFLVCSSATLSCLRSSFMGSALASSMHD